MNPRRFAWGCALAAGLLEAHGATTSGHLLWLAPVFWALAAMLATVEARPLRRGFAHGSLTGAVLGLHAWGVSYYAPGVYFGVIAYNAIVWGGFTVLAVLLLSRAPRVAPLAVGAAWALIESLRGLGALSYPFFASGMLVREGWVLQTVSVVGAAGLSGLVFAVGFAIAGLVMRGFGDARWSAPASWVAPLALLGVAVGGGALRLATAPAAPETLRVSLLQGSVPQWLYSLATGTGPFRRVVEEHYGALYRRALAAKSKPDLVVMPETTFDWHVQATTEGIRRIGPIGATRIPPKTSVVFGASFAGREGVGSYNGVAFVHAGEAGRAVLTEATSKRRLVPFIEAGHEPAGRWASGKIGAGTLFVMICYESMYTDAALAAVREGANLLAVVSDDAGMRYSPLVWTHAEQARLRSVESGLPLVRAGQVGWSYAHDAYGREVATLGHGAIGVLTVDLPMHRIRTIYSRVGYGWIAVWALGAFGPLAVAALRRRKPA